MTLVVVEWKAPGMLGMGPSDAGIEGSMGIHGEGRLAGPAISELSKSVP